MPHAIADPQEAQEFLAQHPEVESIDLLLADQNGVFRGKRIPAQELQKVYEQGMFLPGSVFALDINGNTVEETGIGFDTGDCDQPCRPLPNTLVLCPWQTKPTAQCLLTMEQAPGTAYFANPRHRLALVLERFAELKLTPVVAVELEFYLTDQARNETGMLQPPIAPQSGQRESGTQVYSLENLDDYAAFVDDVMTSAHAQGLPTSTAVAEYAPGQFEINLNHTSDPLAACDQALMLKRIIRSIARQQGFDATFMAKPYGDQAGSGMHVHMSLVDEHGENVFAEGSWQSNPRLQQTIAGMQNTMADVMAILCPKVNSFKRLQPDFFVPMAPTWGYDNRTVALRIPNSEAAARRIEHRVAGADANPYLVMAAILGGCHFGITNELSPTAVTKGNAATQIEPSLPSHCRAAHQRLQESNFAHEYFGQEYLHVYQALQLAEHEAFHRHITALEIDWYQRTI